MTKPFAYYANFTPEAWTGDNAIEVDVEGPREWDCTDFATQHQDYLDGLLDDPDDDEGALDTDDVFKGDPAAPEWIREWRGPFTIRIFRRHTGHFSHLGGTWWCDTCNSPYCDLA